MAKKTETATATGAGAGVGADATKPEASSKCHTAVKHNLDNVNKDTKLADSAAGEYNPNNVNKDSELEESVSGPRSKGKMPATVEDEEGEEPASSEPISSNAGPQQGNSTTNHQVCSCGHVRNHTDTQSLTSQVMEISNSYFNRGSFESGQPAWYLPIGSPQQQIQPLFTHIGCPICGNVVEMVLVPTCNECGGPVESETPGSHTRAYFPGLQRCRATSTLSHCRSEPPPKDINPRVLDFMDRYSAAVTEQFNSLIGVPGPFPSYIDPLDITGRCGVPHTRPFRCT